MHDIYLLQEDLISMKQDRIGKIHSSMYHQCKDRGYAAPVDVLMDIGVLRKQDYENWRNGRVDYLERVCQCNLHKLSEIMKEVRAYAKKNELKPSETVYKQWGKKRRVIKLRFSKSGDPGVERGYSTHYVDSKRIAELKEEHRQKERAANTSKGDNDNEENKTID